MLNRTTRIATTATTPTNSVSLKSYDSDFSLIFNAFLYISTSSEQSCLVTEREFSRRVSSHFKSKTVHSNFSTY